MSALLTTAMASQVLIETLWNVNLTQRKALQRSFQSVLIETLWNVNQLLSRDELQLLLVLIETLWNVNQVLYRKQKDIRSINRNIVECKFRINRNPLVLITVLIETLWNVNEHSDRKEWHKRVCINRNIVECKSGTGAVSAMPYAY